MALTFAVPDSVLSTTLANYAPTLADNIFKANPLFYWMVGKYPMVAGQEIRSRGQLRVLAGGESIVVPLMYGKNSTASAYSGYDTIDITPQDGITAAKYNWKQYSASISISGLEEAQNNSEYAVIDLMEAKIKQAEMSLQEQLNIDAWSTGTDSTKTLMGLGTILTTTGTVGNIARSGNTWWQAKVTGSVGSFASGGRDAMSTMYNNVSRGSDSCDIIIADQTTYERYEKVLNANERFTSKEMGDGGFQNLLFKTAPVTFDTAATSGTISFLNSDYLGIRVHSQKNFATTPFVKPANQDAKVAQILFYGELVASNCARQGYLSGITA